VVKQSLQRETVIEPRLSNCFRGPLSCLHCGYVPSVRFHGSVASEAGRPGGQVLPSQASTRRPSLPRCCGGERCHRRTTKARSLSEPPVGGKGWRGHSENSSYRPYQTFFMAKCVIAERRELSVASYHSAFDQENTKKIAPAVCDVYWRNTRYTGVS